MASIKTDFSSSTPIQAYTFLRSIDLSTIRKKTCDTLHLAPLLQKNFILDIESAKKTLSGEQRVNRQLSFKDCVSPKKEVSPKQVDSGIVSTCTTDCNLESESDKKTILNLLQVLRAFPDEVDSGIASMCKSANSIIKSNKNSDTGSRNLHHYLRSFPTDLNCDIIRKYGNCSSKIYQPYKYIYKKDLKQYQYSKSDVSSMQLLDNNNNTSDYVSQMKKTTHIDFLTELGFRNCTSTISQILSYLPDEDLRKASNVSTNWQNIILRDKKANKRRTDYINNRKNITRGPNKENKLQTKCFTGRNHKTVFINITNASSEVPQQPLYNDNLVGKFNSFYQEAKTLQHKDIMVKCPTCRYPSKIESGNKYCCTRSLCQHQFCKKCLGPYLDNHVCSQPKFKNTSPNIFIGSKKSKKYLRRL